MIVTCTVRIKIFGMIELQKFDEPVRRKMRVE
jgi:hypothetical protein